MLQKRRKRFRQGPRGQCPLPTRKFSQGSPGRLLFHFIKGSSIGFPGVSRLQVVVEPQDWTNVAQESRVPSEQTQSTQPGGTAAAAAAKVSPSKRLQGREQEKPTGKGQARAPEGLRSKGKRILRRNMLNNRHKQEE